MYKTTEIASSEIASDNPIHQRLLFPYIEAAGLVSGNLLEIGCGTGRGVAVLAPSVQHYTGVDKNEPLMNKLSQQYPAFQFIDMFLPPLKNLPDNHFDYIVTFQVIEHIEDDDFFIREAYRVLKPGGKLILTTVNRKYSLSVNPWHVREYSATELKNLILKYFPTIDTKGIHGNEKVWSYYEQNKKSVQKITRFDIFDLQHRLPRRWLQVPYDIANRLSRNLIQKSDNTLVSDITYKDYFLNNDAENCFDFFYVATK
ncbi:MULTISPECIES: class I SAM-dependent methyltransferase [unclassified Siphonobacter]|uniref:class I SAM-dependent methyltransferase n=1 Tax=unclassified Siphonobacter TaxID=2635712 RepID=UPI000CB3E6B8|nr:MULTISPECIES: class I SAM-dependent methyltransferase [unclassified Siphonobacter]MDQ1086274.1 ubiquinone/menaquinone biosynthesis C-methylase UbiE [Siphonobacter sp. SORGH_AS_1065]MDR6196555.1 ubiquinone/menaquinone biosynthesis C-methylase UbiE [Siphonobacter sp. SORGH_AS_0500]PKK35820.1 SAM-dependent methyltransferase [Siphonobacter sp. SORGH_AS_0500]